MTTTISGTTGCSLVEDETITEPKFANALFEASLGATGYQKLPSGLILQWGRASVAGSGTTAVTFPTAFPTACVYVNNETSVASEVCYPTSVTTTGFTANQSGGTPSNIFWFAMGY